MYRLVMECAKAIMAFVTAGTGALLTANTDGRITAQEWVWAGATGFVAAAAVFGTSNAEAPSSSPE